MLRDQQSLSIIAPLFPRVQGNQAGVLGGCAGGVAPLRPYCVVGQVFRCFAWGRIMGDNPAYGGPDQVAQQ